MSILEFLSDSCFDHFSVINLQQMLKEGIFEKVKPNLRGIAELSNHFSASSYLLHFSRQNIKESMLASQCPILKSVYIGCDPSCFLCCRYEASLLSLKTSNAYKHPQFITHLKRVITAMSISLVTVMTADSIGCDPSTMHCCSCAIDPVLSYVKRSRMGAFSAYNLNDKDRSKPSKHVTQVEMLIRKCHRRDHLHRCANCGLELVSKSIVGKQKEGIIGRFCQQCVGEELVVRFCFCSLECHRQFWPYHRFYHRICSFLNPKAGQQRSLNEVVKIELYLTKLNL